MRKSFKTKVIRYFILPAAVLIIFVSKNNKTLKLLVNYRSLNNIIIKNCYSLLLITKGFNRLTGAVVFIKLNIKNAYNKIRIRQKNK